MEIPFIVAGTGGRGIIGVATADGSRIGDHSFDSSLMGYGYLTITATAEQLTIRFTQVDQSNKKSAFDKIVVVDLKTNHSLTFPNG